MLEQDYLILFLYSSVRPISSACSKAGNIPTKQGVAKTAAVSEARRPGSTLRGLPEEVSKRSHVSKSEPYTLGEAVRKL